MSIKKPHKKTTTQNPNPQTNHNCIPPNFLLMFTCCLFIRLLCESVTILTDTALTERLCIAPTFQRLHPLLWGCWLVLRTVGWFPRRWNWEETFRPPLCSVDSAWSSRKAGQPLANASSQVQSRTLVLEWQCGWRTRTEWFSQLREFLKPHRIDGISWATTCYPKQMKWCFPAPWWHPRTDTCEPAHGDFLQGLKHGAWTTFIGMARVLV